MAAISATWAKTMIAETAIAVTSASKAFNVAGLKTALMITASDWARDAMRRVPAHVLRREALAGVVRIDHDVQLRRRYAVVAEELAIWTRDLAVASRGPPHTPAAGYSGARTGVSWCSDSPRKNGFCSPRRAIKNMIGSPRTIEPMTSRNTLPISTLVPGMGQPPR